MSLALKRQIWHQFEEGLYGKSCHPANFPIQIFLYRLNFKLMPDLMLRTWNFACLRSFLCSFRLWYSKTHQGRFFSHVVNFGSCDQLLQKAYWRLIVAQQFRFSSEKIRFESRHSGRGMLSRSRHRHHSWQVVKHKTAALQNTEDRLGEDGGSLPYHAKREPGGHNSVRAFRRCLAKLHSRGILQ